MPERPISRRDAISALASIAALPLLSACKRDGDPALAKLTTMNEADASALLDEVGENLLHLMPEQATSLGVDTGARAALRSALADRSAEGQRRIAQQLRADLDRVNAADTSALSHGTRTSIEVVRSAYGTALEGFALPYGDVAVGGWRNTPYVVIQNVGAYLDVPRFLDTDHRIESASDAEAYLARLQSYAKQLDGELGRMRAAREAGLVPPAFLIDKAVAQMTLSASEARKGGGLVESLTRRSKTIPGDWSARARTIVVQEIAPALDRQLAELQAQRAVATSDAGIMTRPRGEEYYRWALKASTTTSMSPDEVHALGQAELRQLHAQMDTLLKGIGHSTGTVGERMQALARDPRYKFAAGDAGRAEIMTFINERVAWIRAQMPRAFNTIVDPNMEVKRLPPEEEPGAPAAYGGAGSIDGKIPGRMWINLRTTELHSKYSLADLTFHEAIPGHVWQGEYTRQMPLIRQMLSFNSYSEGWALYAEQLADELGAYDDDRVGRLGYLQSLAFRACRMVVDTGLHAKAWTRERAVQFFVEANGSNPLEVASEVDRYCSWPGQACGYKVGHSEINRQRERATTALGAKFDLKAFDDAVVRGGNVGLDVLAKNVDEYVRSTSRKMRRFLCCCLLIGVAARDEQRAPPMADSSAQRKVTADPEAIFRVQVGRTWELVRLGSQDIGATHAGSAAPGRGRYPGPRTRPTIRFTAEPATVLSGGSGGFMAGGWSFCNGYGSAYELGPGDGLRFHQFQSTLVGCNGPDSLETRFFRALAETRRFELDPSALSLVAADGSRLMFVPAPDSARGQPNRSP